MKPQIPAHPHKTTTRAWIDDAQLCHVRIDVSFTVPSRVAAHLTEYADGSHVIQCAQIVEERHLACRVRNWKHDGAARLRAAIAEGCDTRIFTRITAEEWHLVGRLCGKLNITPGQWFLSCAAYNADLAEQAIERRLAEIPELPADQVESATPAQ